MSARRDLDSTVEERAGQRCEYCRMHQSLQGASFHLEHAVPRSKGGGDGLDNLAWACPSCNLRKSDRTVAADPHSGDSTPLFNPRTDRWDEHFAWHEYHLVGLTPIGRATVAAFDLNSPRRVLIRQVESAFELFPPAS
ncbi:HNH endonuclease [Lacipirellula parvula]|uniref:HNH endonuclease n=1 Tax=Lacipirellula parvula TaxID=2650471 RepID=UPI00126082C3|nr:HNH endonuclease signature motif containing protein [Lacipirellula parvula]